MKPTTLERDRGAVSIFVAVLGVAFLLTAGLALDGGRKLGALSDARDLADNAARAGAQEIDPDAYIATGTPQLDPDAAYTAATSYLAATGNTGTVVVTGDTVTVTVAIDVNPRFLPGDWTVTATESATATFGVQGAL